MPPDPTCPPTAGTISWATIFLWRSRGSLLRQRTAAGVFMLVDVVAGARPNFMKIAPIIRAFEAARKRGGPLTYRLVHTGQHYDSRMSGDFFRQLGIPEPHVNLEVGSGTQAEQTALIMIR